jgi:dimethylhistidine N-methyltransferase
MPPEMMTSRESDRLYIDTAFAYQAPDDERLIAGLSDDPKTIPAQYFYDDRGSQLFEQICELPEYYLTRTEAQLLADSAPTIAQITQAGQLIELGSGSSSKTRLLISALQHHQQKLTYVPIDISGGILAETAQKLLVEYPQLTIHGIVATYRTALTALPEYFGVRMFCFLGSSLGNFSPSEAQELFQQIRGAMKAGDYFLLGIDCHKDQDILQSAYNDSAQITAQFNQNMLAHLNDRFAGNFRLQNYSHRAIYNQTAQQIEMYLISKQTQQVELKKLGLTLQISAGEAIRTEISRKFIPEQLSQELEQVGLKTLQIFRDPQNWYALLLCQL